MYLVENINSVCQGCQPAIFQMPYLFFQRCTAFLFPLTNITPPLPLTSYFPSDSLQNSVTRSAPVNSDSQGRCGARFLTTYDRRFVIKAVSSEDVAEMHNILKKYHQVW